MLKKLPSIIGLFLLIFFIVSPVQAGSIKDDRPLLSSRNNNTCAAFYVAWRGQGIRIA